MQTAPKDCDCDNCKERADDLARAIRKEELSKSAIEGLDEQRRKNEEMCEIAFLSPAGLELRAVWFKRGGAGKKRSIREARFLSALVITGDVTLALKTHHMPRTHYQTWMRCPEFANLVAYILEK